MTETERIQALETALRALIEAPVGCGCCTDNGLGEYYEAVETAERLLNQ